MNDKELLKLIKQRRSIRNFKNTPIKREDLIDLIEAGIYAPSGSNTQCYRFIIITNEDDIKFLGEKKIPIVANAKAIILVVADLKECKYLQTDRKEVFEKLPYQDCAIAIGNIILLAEAKGIANCIIHLSRKWRTANEIAVYFNLGYDYELQGLIMLGYSNEVIDYETAIHSERLIKRKPISEYILEERK